MFIRNSTPSYLLVQIILIRYEVEFSRPTNMKPIPEATVKTEFFITEKSNGEKIIEFQFENESLRHQMGLSMRTNMVEVHNIFYIYIVMD
jgi:hypothetical protein